LRTDTVAITKYTIVINKTTLVKAAGEAGKKTANPQAADTPMDTMK
jgi:hypothetical protein